MKRVEKNVLEWIVFSASGVLVLATLAYLAYSELSYSNGPAVLEVRLGAPARHGEAWAVPVTVENRGAGAAETVLVRVEHVPPDGRREESDVEIALLPGYSERDGWVMFSSDPGEGELAARVVGYQEG